MHITLRQLRIFEAVARQGSVSRAAAELNLTQPAVSMQLKQLEDQIGLKLVEQIGKRMCLTEAGQELRGHAGRMAAQTSELKAAMDQFRGLERGVLRLAVVSTANYFLPPRIAEFTTRYPGVRVTLRVDNRDAVLAALTDNLADLAVTGRPPSDAQVSAQYFADNPLVVIAPPGHRLAKAASVRLEEFGDEVILLRELGSGTRAAVDRHFSAHNVRYQPGCELSSNEAIKQAVQAGLGLGVVPAQTVELEIETRRLVLLPVTGFPVVRQWFIVHRSDGKLSAASQEFRNLLLSRNAAEQRYAIP
jgi:DNA-binding transcriptional LysR family regulator